MIVRIALAQAPSEIGNVKKNWKTAKNYIDRAAKAKANILVFPELFLQGYLANEYFADEAVVLPEFIQDEMTELSKKHGLFIVMGLARADSDFPHLVYNSALITSDNGQISVYDKIHLGTYGKYVEGCYFAPGKKITALTTPYGKIGVEICSDMAFPEMARVLALKGAVLNVVISAGPDEFKHVWPSLLMVRSLENVFFTAYVNTVGKQNGVNFFGGSRIIDPTGTTVAKAPMNKSFLLVKDINLAEVKKLRRQRLLFRDRFPELYKPILEKIY